MIMKNEKIYIAGKISGERDYKVLFRAGVLRVLGYGFGAEDVVNPVELCPEGWPWWRCMVRCLWALKGCSFVAMLPNWKESRGARIEHWVAKVMRKWIIYIKFNTNI